MKKLPTAAFLVAAATAAERAQPRAGNAWERRPRARSGEILPAAAAGARQIRLETGYREAMRIAGTRCSP